MQELNNGDTLPETLTVQNYGLAEWLKDVEQAIHNGYEFDFDSNEGYPQSIGHVFTCIMKLHKYKWLEQTVQQVEPVLDFPPIVEPVEIKDVLVIAPFATGGLLPDEQKLVGEQPSDQKVYPGGSPDTPVMTETPEQEQPAKRGPKPKNK